jgi:ABC-type nitrate/sulfonate/bicarbonate transport system ATPase subunit
VEVDVMSLLQDDANDDLISQDDPLLPAAALLQVPLPLTVHLTVMVVGEAGVGKSTLSHFIAEAMPSHEGHMRRKMPPPTGETIDFDESRRFVINLPPTARTHGRGNKH